MALREEFQPVAERPLGECLQHAARRGRGDGRRKAPSFVLGNNSLSRHDSDMAETAERKNIAQRKRAAGHGDDQARRAADPAKRRAGANPLVEFRSQYFFQSVPAMEMDMQARDIGKREVEPHSARNLQTGDVGSDLAQRPGIQQGPCGPFQRGGAANFFQSPSERFPLAIRGRFFQQGKKLGFLCGIHPDLGQGCHGIPADFFLRITQQRAKPIAGKFLLLRRTRFGKHNAHGANDGHAFGPLSGAGPIDAQRE